jgi:KaiC/GvpD/RAD55 family RecA-like ATPase
MADFLVERYWPGVTEADVRQLGERLLEASGAARYMGRARIVDDEVVLFAFRARDEHDVRATATAAGLRCDRIVVADFG